MDFEGRVALVTGAASGIGRAAAEVLRERGARVVGFDRDETARASFAERYGHPGVVGDVTDRGTIAAALAAIEGECGGVDVLVTAAGLLQPPRRPEEISEREFDKIVDVNFKGTWLTATLVGAAMAKRGKGAIVTVGSVTGLAGGPLHVYGPVKAAIVNLTQGLAGAWAPQGVRVNAVAPGFTSTPALDLAIAVRAVDAARLAGAAAMGRLVTPREVAEVVAFLASDAASAVTGAVVTVDAGAMLTGGFAPFGGVPEADSR